MANFTPQEIEEMLREFFDVVGKRQYVGARYVPIFGRKGEDTIEWDNLAPYEPLTIVLYQGNSYTSRTYVPARVEITDTHYWALTGNYNAQVEAYRREVAQSVETVHEWLDESQELYKEKTFSFDSVKTMCESDTLYKGAIATTAGFYNAGDGGGATYSISDSGIVDNITVFAAGELYATLIPSKGMCPEMFGAKKDGTNDANAISKCIEYSLGNVQLLRGTYTINDTININRPCNIFGNDSVILMPSDIQIMKCIRIRNTSDITINNLFFKGYADPITDDESGLVAIEALYSNNIIINNCVFDGWHKNIELTNCEKCNIINNNILNAKQMATNKINGYGILLESCVNIIISKNNIYQCERHSIYLNECTNTTVTENILYTTVPNQNSGWEGQIKTDGVTNVIISNNTIIGGVYAIAVLQAFGDTDFRGAESLVISNNIIRDQFKPGAAYFRACIGISLEALPETIVKDVLITNNIIEITNNTNKEIDGILVDNCTCENISITNNKIKNVRYGVRIVAENSPIEITNNSCIDCTAGLDINHPDLLYFGDCNSFNNCENAITNGQYTIRKLNFIGMKNMQGQTQGLAPGETTLKPTEYTVFKNTSPSGQVIINDIENGFVGQSIFILCSVSGTISFAANDKIKLATSNRSLPVCFIELVTDGYFWFEVSRIEY